MSGLLCILATLAVAGVRAERMHPILEDSLNDLVSLQKSVHLFVQDWLDNSYTDLNLTVAQQDYYDSLSEDENIYNPSLSQELKTFFLINSFEDTDQEDSVLALILDSFHSFNKELEECFNEILNDDVAESEGYVLKRRKRSLLPDVEGLSPEQKKRIRSRARAKIKARGQKAWRDFLKKQRQNRKDRGIFRGQLTADKKREKYLRKRKNKTGGSPPSTNRGKAPPVTKKVAAPPPPPSTKATTPSERIATANPSDTDHVINQGLPKRDRPQSPPPSGNVVAAPPPAPGNEAPSTPKRPTVPIDEHINTANPKDVEKVIDKNNNVNRVGRRPPAAENNVAPPPARGLVAAPPAPPGNDANAKDVDKAIDGNDKVRPPPPPSQQNVAPPPPGGIIAAPAPPKQPEVTLDEHIPVPDPHTLDQAINDIVGRKKRSTTKTMRKEYHDLSQAEKDNFKVALKWMKTTYAHKMDSSLSNYDIFVKQHRMLENPLAYSNKYSLLWHRNFLKRFEAALKDFDSTFNLPFLNICKLINSTKISTATIWREFLFDTKVINDCSWIGQKLKRSILTSDVILQRVKYILNCSGDNRKRKRFEIEEFAQIHSLFGPCVEGGSHMACPTCAVTDPIFWMIYAYLDDHI